MRQNNPRYWLRILLTISSVVLSSVGYGRTVVDMTGQRVDVPDHAGRIADLWFAHNAVTIMLGGAARIVVTNDLPAARPWMFRVAPELYHAVGVTGPTPNIEMLRGAGVDVAFVSNGSPALGPLRRNGISVVQAGFTNEASLRKAMILTAQVINDPHAYEIVGRYVTLLDATQKRIEQAITDLPEARRPRVLHIQSLVPLKIDGTHTIIDDWIMRAGGRNAVDIAGNMRPVSIEQIAVWDPDIIILGGDSGAFDPSSTQWRGLRAVRAHRVYRNPSGVFPWDRYGVEFPLQLLWVAHVLHPDRFAQLDMVAETIKFYHDFFRYDLSPKDAAHILAATGPDSAP